MAKQIKISSPRGLSKTMRQLEDLYNSMPKFDTDSASDQGEYAHLAHLARELKKGPQATPPSSTRKLIKKRK